MLGELKQRSNETAFEYKVRICLMKLNKEINLDWYEIVELLGLECSSDHLRKLAYAYKEYHNYIQEHPNTDSTEEHIAKINEKIRELEITKIQVADEKRMYKQVLREEARRRALVKSVKESIEDLNRVSPMLNKWHGEVKGNKIISVLLSDLHYGSAFDTTINSYNSKIAQERLMKYKNKIIELCNRNDISTIKEINVELLGDLIEQALHYTARIDTDRNVAEQVVECSNLVAEFIYSLAKETGLKINVANVEGNHCRISIDKEKVCYGETFIGIMEVIMKGRLKEVENVKFIKNEISNNLCIINVFDKKIGLTHGHLEKKQTGRKQLNQFLEGYYYLDEVHMGHYHHAEMNGDNIIINGSVKGTDRYAQNLRYSGKPEQVVVVYEEDGTESIVRIKLD